MKYPTPLMLALSAAVLMIDPSVPLPNCPATRCLEENAPHWRAVASYAEAFPAALSKKIEHACSLSEKSRGPEYDAERVAAEAREIRKAIGEGKALV